MQVCRLLVTGAEGFVGRALCRSLAGFLPPGSVFGSTRTGEPVAGCAGAVHLDLSGGDIAGTLAAVKPDAVFHLAARSSVAQAQGAGHQTFADNGTAAIRLAEAMRAVRPGVPLIFASSGEVYGASFTRGAAVDESIVPAPQNAYARSKLAGEFAFRDILAEVSPVIVLRLFNHFGPGQDERFVIPALARQISAIPRDGAGEILVGNLEAVRDFLPLDDVLAAYRCAYALALAEPVGFRVFNVSSGCGRSIRSVLDTLISLSGRAVTVRQDPARMRVSDIPFAAGDPSAFQAATGWRPAADWQQALAAMMAVQPGGCQG